MLLKGHSSDSIIAHCEVMWDIKERMARNYIGWANDLLDSYVVDDTEKAIKRHVQTMNMVKLQGFESKNGYVVLEAQKEIARVMGLYKQDKLTLELSSEIVELMNVLKVSPEVLRSGIQTMLERRVESTVH